jgi:WD40 repeat protein
MTNPPVKLQPFRVLGIDRSRNTRIYVLSEHSVVYFAGTHIVKHDLESGEQRLLPYTDIEHGEANCVAVTTNSALMAFAVEMDCSIIHLVDIQNWRHRPPILLPAESLSAPVTALAFSGNSKFLVAHAGDSLFYFDVKGGNLLGTYTGPRDPLRGEVTCISFNPTDPLSICCTGNDIFRQLTKGPRGFTLKRSSIKSAKFHVWTLDGRTLILALADGGLLQVDSPSARVEIPLCDPTHLVATQKGFLCVTKPNILHFFERSGPRGFVEIATVPIEGYESITAVSIGQSGDRVCVLMSGARLISVALPSGDAQELLPPRHSGPIAGMDVACRKPLLVSCSEDHSIRVWNYETMQCEVVRFFADPPLSISFHPGGDWIVAGFPEALRFMAIAGDEIESLREFPVRGCRECRFSHGGQTFAAVTGNSVLLFSSDTFKQVAWLRSEGFCIKTITWSTDDSVLIICDINGSVALCNVITGEKRVAGEGQTFHFTSIVCRDATGAKCYGVTGFDPVLRATDDYVTTDELSIDGTPCQLAIGPNNRCIFVSTRGGMVLNYCFPGSSGTGSNFPSAENVVKYALHRGPITSLVISPDTQYLFTAGEDACIFVMKISVTEPTGPK